MKATAPARLLAIEVGLVPCGARAQFLLACGTRAGIVATLFVDRILLWHGSHLQGPIHIYEQQQKKTTRTTTTTTTTKAN